MASVTLEGLWLHTASNLADFLVLHQNAQVETVARPMSMRFTFPLLPRADIEALRERVTEDVEVRRYAGGRTRAVARGDLHLQMLRDQRGRKAWGVVHELEVTESRDVPMAEASFTFTAVTYDEAV